MECVCACHCACACVSIHALRGSGIFHATEFDVCLKLESTALATCNRLLKMRTYLVAVVVLAVLVQACLAGKYHRQNEVKRDMELRKSDRAQHITEPMPHEYLKV